MPLLEYYIYSYFLAIGMEFCIVTGNKSTKALGLKFVWSMWGGGGGEECFGS